jgi:hypothetical protein
MERRKRFHRIDRMLQGGARVPFRRLQESLAISRAQLEATSPA